jgi:hypothetical protein
MIIFNDHHINLDDVQRSLMGHSANRIHELLPDLWLAENRCLYASFTSRWAQLTDTPVDSKLSCFQRFKRFWADIADGAVTPLMNCSPLQYIQKGSAILGQSDMISSRASFTFSRSIMTIFPKYFVTFGP